jgi:hypothetical protein
MRKKTIAILIHLHSEKAIALPTRHSFSKRDRPSNSSAFRKSDRPPNSPFPFKSDRHYVAAFRTSDRPLKLSFYNGKPNHL